MVISLNFLLKMFFKLIFPVYVSDNGSTTHSKFGLSLIFESFGLFLLTFYKNLVQENYSYLTLVWKNCWWHVQYIVLVLRQLMELHLIEQHLIRTTFDR